MNVIFQIVYKILLLIADLLGLTYHEINIVVYYIWAPALFLYLVGRIRRNYSLLIGFSAIVTFSLFIIPDFSLFSTRLFDKSVDFLNWFEIVGLNYIEASVVICVILPAVLLYLMLRLGRRQQTFP